jgi:hypothetical protein
MWQPIQYHQFDESFPYTGEELRPHFILEKSGVYGSVLSSWIGECHVPTGSLVDYEDRLALDFIKSKEMIHFVGEFFGPSLIEGVLLQRLFVTHAERVLRDFLPEGKRKFLTRAGDDLFFDQMKLSVSIVTSSLFSQLFHFGLNVDAEGAPVLAGGLKDMGLATQAELIATTVGEAFCEEAESCLKACVKVKARVV